MSWLDVACSVVLVAVGPVCVGLGIWILWIIHSQDRRR